MIKSNLKYAVYMILLLMACSSRHIFGQIPVRMGPGSADEIKKARTALEVNMNDENAHRTFIFAMGLGNPLLVAQYEDWMKKYPENINIPLSIGTVFYRAEMSQGREFLERASAMDPQNAEIWFMLSEDAFTRGEKKLSREYMKKASLSDKTNARYASAYLMSFEDNEPDYKQKVFDFINRFPTNGKGAQLLYGLAENNTSINERINYFEQLRKLYPPQKFNWSAAGMIHLADDYLQTNPEKALALINGLDDGKDWKLRKQAAESLIQINKLEENQNYKDAIMELNGVKLPAFNYINDFIVLKKSYLLDKAGNTKAAYDSLAVKFAKAPSDQFNDALELYGKKLGIDKGQVTRDIETLRYSVAAPAYPFELERYNNNEKLSLESLKGKVVLLTFWFPGCTPCREEFPYFQAVIDKFKGEKVAYLGINVFPHQDPYVLPFMQNTKFSFIPLRGSAEFAAKNFGVNGEPENFLIDKDGKIIFRNFRIDNTNHRTLELMISSLLKKEAQSN